MVPCNSSPGITTAGRLTCFWHAAGAAIQGDITDLVVPVDRILLYQGQHLLASIIDKNEADEGTEAFLREAGEILHKVTGFSSYKNETKDGHPETNPEAEF